MAYTRYSIYAVARKKWRGPDYGDRGARAYNGGLGKAPSEVQGQSGQRVRGRSLPLEAKSFLRIGHPKEGQTGLMSVF